MKKVNVPEAVKLYKSGLSLGEVGRILGHHHSVIKYHIIRNGIEIREQKEAQRKPIDSSGIANMYLDGMSANEIAKTFGVTYQCIYDRLAEEGIKTRNRREQIKSMIQRGTYNVRKGETHKNWKGGKTQSGGYTLLMVDRHKYKPEHRIVWEQHNGPLPKNWVVHHLNGNKSDNRIENLAGMPRKIHSPKSIVEPYKKRIQELEAILNKNLKKRV